MRMSQTLTSDFIIIGGGIAGASAAHALAPHGSVTIVERESQPGYHSTGRSAAVFSETYGHRVIRAITSASRTFYEQACDGLVDRPVMSPRGALHLGGPADDARLDGLHSEIAVATDRVARLDAAAARALVPGLKEEGLGGAVHEPDATDLDVHAIHMAFLRGARASGAQVVTDAEVARLEREDGAWRLETTSATLAAPIIVNAAGAWADEVGRLAGAAPLGLVPKRRTAFVFDADFGGPAPRSDHWPLVVDLDERFYFKPETGRFLGSPADETPVPPQDIQPEEFDIAVAIDRIEGVAAFRVGRLVNRWAGLRSFVADKVPVVGWDGAVDGLFWLAGQGGYGIQTAPAMGRIAASLILGDGLPEDVAGRGVVPADLDPARLRGVAT